MFSQALLEGMTSDDCVITFTGTIFNGWTSTEDCCKTAWEDVIIGDGRTAVGVKTFTFIVFWTGGACWTENWIICNESDLFVFNLV